MRLVEGAPGQAQGKVGLLASVPHGGQPCGPPEGSRSGETCPGSTWLQKVSSGQQPQALQGSAGGGGGRASRQVLWVS